MTKTLGDLCEQLAVVYLESKNWNVIARNVTFTFGEIDIVAQNTHRRGRGYVKRLAFIEVKTRSRKARCRPEQSVTAAKRRKIVALAKCFLAKENIHDACVQFDVIAIDVGDDIVIRHFPCAFDAAGEL